MNLFIFNGTICRDIELKYTQNQGMSVISNSLAFNKKDANGNQSAVFLDFVAFGKTAELINQYYQKGDMLCGQGEISQDEWQDKDTGAKRTKHKIIIQKLEFTKSPKAWASGANGANSTHNGANGGANSNVSYNQAPQAPQNYNQAPQAPQSYEPAPQYGNYDHMPDTVTNAVAKHNAQAQAQSQNLAQELDEIPF